MKNQGFKANTIIDYLAYRKWKAVKQNERFVRLMPPKSLNLPVSYSLVIPASENAPDFNANILKVIKIISDIYDISQTKLKSLFLQDGTILSFRFDDEETINGSLSFSHFESFLEKFKKTLLDIASSTAFKTPFIEEYAMEAVTYLNNCKYLQTEHGSFVTNIQLPSELVLREATLFDPNPFFAEEINERIFEYLEFTVNTIFENNKIIYDENFIMDKQNFLSVQIFEDIDDVIKKAHSQNIYFSFIGKKYSKEIRAENITKEKFEHLSDYIHFLRTEVEDNIPMNIVGKIVELRSRNPSSNQNYILVSTQYENQSIFLAMHLDNVDYQSAIQAHKNNREINVIGKAKRMRTQYKITLLEYIKEV